MEEAARDAAAVRTGPPGHTRLIDGHRGGGAGGCAAGRGTRGIVGGTVGRIVRAQGKCYDITSYRTDDRAAGTCSRGRGGWWASGKNRRKVAALPVYVGRENACDACKTHGKADICAEGTGVACAECQHLKGHCSFAQGRRGAGKKAVEAEGSMETTRCEYATYPRSVATDENDSRSTGSRDR